MKKSKLGKLTAISGVLMLLGVSFASQSAVYKCQVNGKTVYQSSACFNGKQTVLHPTKHDTGLHASWFVRPEMLPASANCETAQCQCGKQTLPLTGDSVNDVATSLNALITDWQSHQQAFLNYQGLTTEDALASSLRNQVATSACNIAMHQVLINQHYLSVLNSDTRPSLTAKQENAIQVSCEAEFDKEQDADLAKTQIEECIIKTKEDAIARIIEEQQPEQKKAEITAKFAQPVAILKLKNPYVNE